MNEWICKICIITCKFGLLVLFIFLNLPVFFMHAKIFMYYNSVVPLTSSLSVHIHCWRDRVRAGGITEWFGLENIVEKAIFKEY